MSSNGVTMADEDGDFPDWIELENVGTESVSLEGWHLSDTANNAHRWQLPAISIGPSERLLIWASGKDRSAAGKALHTNFKISADGEGVFLTRADTTLADGISIAWIPRDISFGRSEGNREEWLFFANPTPGAPNTSEGRQRVLRAPGLYPAPGFYADAIDLTASSVDSDIELRYTLDGSIPNNASPRLDATGIRIDDRYGEQPTLAKIRTVPTNEPWSPPNEPIQLSTVVRVRAFSQNAIPSETATGTYFVGSSLFNRYTMPVISVIAEADDLFHSDRGIYVAGNGSTPNWNRRGISWERRVHVELFEENGERVINQDAGVRIHGGASRSYALKSLRLYARSEYGDATFDHAIFPDQPFNAYKRLLLRNSGQDAKHSYIRDGFMQALVAHLRIDTQAYRPAIVFLNGEYWGIHNIRERFDRHYFERKYGAQADNIDHLSQEISPTLKVQEGDKNHYLGLLNLAQYGDPADAELYALISSRMDIDNYIDYQIAQIYLNNVDWPGNNVDFWRARSPIETESGQLDGRWRWLLFDTDFGYGLHSDNSSWGPYHQVLHNTLSFAASPQRTPVSNLPNWPNPPHATLLFRRLLRNTDFRQAFITRFADQLNTGLKASRADALLTQFEDRIADSLPEHMARWRFMTNSSNRGPERASELMHAFANGRTDQVFGHIRDYFGLADPVAVTIDVNDSNGGSLQINTVSIDATTLGLDDPDEPYPWSGFYFPSVEVTVHAHPAPGYQFERWEEFPSHGNPYISIDPEETRTLTARFTPHAAPWPSGSIWDDFEPLGSGYHGSDWFGSVYLAYYPWCYHSGLGWLFFATAFPDNLWLWDFTFGWLWSSRELYPIFYAFHESEWIQYAGRTQTGSRAFWSFGQSKWLYR